MFNNAMIPIIWAPNRLCWRYRVYRKFHGVVSHYEAPKWIIIIMIETRTFVLGLNSHKTVHWDIFSFYYGLIYRKQLVLLQFKNFQLFVESVPGSKVNKIELPFRTIRFWTTKLFLWLWKRVTFQKVIKNQYQRSENQKKKFFSFFW